MSEQVPDWRPEHRRIRQLVAAVGDQAALVALHRALSESVDKAQTKERGGGKTKKNPGELSCEERLAEALTERETASATCMKLIGECERLIELLLDTRKSQAVDAAQESRMRIAKIRRGK